MKGLAAKLHRLWLQFVLLVVYMIHLPFFLVLSRSPRLYGLLNFTRNSCSAGFMMISGIFFDIRYEKKLDSRAAYVFCPNHTSYLDIPLMCLVAHGTFHLMGKEELVRNPLFRLFFRTIEIERKRVVWGNGL